MQKYSRQREIIINCLKNRYDHPSANMVYDSVREEIPNISLGTVYRNLTKLAEDGTIQRIAINNSADRFDWNEESHYHFRCEECDSLIDLDFKPDSQDTILSTIEGEVPQVNSYQLIFSGICCDCLKKKAN